jgi:hypothetical protein
MALATTIPKRPVAEISVAGFDPGKSRSKSRFHWHEFIPFDFEKESFYEQI